MIIISRAWAWCAVLVLGIIAAVWWLSGARAAPREYDAQLLTLKEMKKSRNDLLEAIALESVDASGWEDALASRVRSAGASFTEKQRQMLAGVLTGHIRARSVRDASALRDFMETLPGHWLRPDEDEMEWKKIAQGYQEVAQKPVRREDPAEAFTALYAWDLSKQNARIGKAPSSPEGIRIVTGKTLRASEVHSPTSKDEAERSFWMGYGTMVTSTMRRPPRSLELVLKEHRSVDFAQVWIVLESEIGRRYVWRSHWYWDPKSGSWSIESSAIQGGNAPHGWRM